MVVNLNYILHHSIELCQRYLYWEPELETNEVAAEFSENDPRSVPTRSTLHLFCRRQQRIRIDLGPQLSAGLGSQRVSYLALQEGTGLRPCVG